MNGSVSAGDSGKGGGMADEEAPTGPLDDSVEIDKPSASPSSPCWRRRSLLIATLSSLGVAIVLVATIGALVPRSGDSDAAAEASGLVPGESGTVAPSASPTSSPTVPPQWKVDYKSLTADFSLDSEHEVVVEYEIGAGRAYESQILAADCETPISGITLDLTAERTPKDQYRDQLSLMYGIDKAQIRGSNAWDEDKDTLRLCQTVQLVLPADVSSSGETLVIIEDKRVLEIDFDFEVSFGIGLEVELGDDPNTADAATTGGVDSSGST